MRLFKPKPPNNPTNQPHHDHQRGLEAFRACVPLFETLKDEQRLAILAKLLDQGPTSAGQLVDESDLSPSAISHHLKLLLQVGLVSYQKQGTKRIYRAEITAGIALLKQLVAVLEEK